MEQTKIQDKILSDCSSTGRERPWRIYKIMNTYLAMLYEAVSPRKAERLRNCATMLDFEVDVNGRKRLLRANFCRVRLCPTCCWRRSLKAFSQVSEIKNYLDKQPNRYAYLFLSLTVKNCWAEDLEDTMDKMFDNFQNLTRWKSWQKAVKGYVRAFEVTRNVDKESEWYGSYHPHVHFILAVDANHYFSKDRDLYISQEQFQEKWRKIMDLDYNPQVRVDRIKDFNANTIAEIAKYSVKFSDYLDYADWDFSQEAVKVLDRVLDKRRFLAFSGCFKEARDALKLDDIEEGDFAYLKPKDFLDPGYKVIRYFWSGGYNEYVER